MMLLKGKKEMKVQVSSLLRKQDILLFNHNSSTFEPFYSSLSPPPVTSKSPNQPPLSPTMSLSHPEPGSSLHFKLGTYLPTKLKRSGASSTPSPTLQED